MGYECLLNLDEKYGERLNGATLILGNGSSISCSSNFNYKNLYEKTDFIAEEKCIFEKFKTENFECILRKLFQASEINKVLELDPEQKVKTEYEAIRIKLIETIKSIHPARENLGLPFIHNKVFNNLIKYKYIIDLNYDFILYWILSAQDEDIFPSEDDEHEKYPSESPFDYFYDGFCCSENECLSFNYEYTDQCRESDAKPKTGIFYPHGNLLLVRSRIDEETLKIISHGNLIDTVDDNWKKGNTPLFVSEGTEDQKLRSIRSVPYLNYVYNEILGNLTEFIVIYGWSMSDCDDHLVHKIFHNKKVKKVAISIYTDGKDNDQIGREESKIIEKLKSENNALDIEFWEC